MPQRPVYTPPKALVLDALTPLGEGAVCGGSGAIYLFVLLPPGCADDVAVVRWLTDAHGVCLIPGSGCGMPGHVSCRQRRTWRLGLSGASTDPADPPAEPRRPPVVPPPPPR